MPMFDGLKKCCVRPPPTGARKMTFDATLNAAAKAIGHMRSFGYSSIAQAKPGMIAGTRRLMKFAAPPAKRGGRWRAWASTQSSSNVMSMAVPTPTKGATQGCSNPRYRWPRIFHTVSRIRKYQSAMRRYFGLPLG